MALNIRIFRKVDFVISILALFGAAIGGIFTYWTNREREQEIRNANERIERMKESTTLTVAQKKYEYEVIKDVLAGYKDDGLAARRLKFYSDIGVISQQGKLEAYITKNPAAIPTAAYLNQPGYAVKDIVWRVGLPRYAEFLASQPICKPGSISPVAPSRGGTPEKCQELLNSKSIVKEGAIDGKYVIWWPNTKHGEWPQCACVPDASYSRSITPVPPNLP